MWVEIIYNSGTIVFSIDQWKVGTSCWSRKGGVWPSLPNMKQIYKQKLKIYKGMILVRLKEKNFQAILVNFHQRHRWGRPICLFNYIFIESTDWRIEKVHTYKSVECYNHFKSGRLKELKMKLLLYHLLKLPWLLGWIRTW